MTAICWNVALLSAAALTTAALAQTITVPNAPVLVEHKVVKYKIAIQVPSNWKRVEGGAREIFVGTGYIDEVKSTCMIRLISIAELGNATPQAFVDSMTKEKFLEMASISGSKPDVHVFDTASLGGLVARRIVHTQSFNGTRLTYISHQALRGPEIFTVSCYADQVSFERVMGTFGMIIGTTRFLAAERDARPTYGEVQRAWGVIVGDMLAIFVWHDECAARRPTSRQAFEQPFADWKERNRYMDELRDTVYKRAQLEGGDAEAVRLSNEMRSVSENRAETLRIEIRSGNDWECGKLLLRLTGRQFDAIERYRREVDIVRRAVE